MIYKKLKDWIKKISESKLKIFFLLSFIILAVYFQSINFKFTALDDYDLIVNKFHILSRIENLPSLFSTNLLMSESGVYYRPFVSLTFMIDTLIGGKSSSFFHLTNVIYHIIATFLFFLMMDTFLQSRLKSFLFSLIFAIHPALTQAVVWVPGRNDTLLFIFIAITFLFYQKFSKSGYELKRGNFLFLIISSISFLIALFTKENAVLILVFIFLYKIFYEKDKVLKKEQILIFAFYIIPILVYLILRSQAKVQKTDLEQITISIFDYIQGVINYFGKIFLPFNLNVISLVENIDLTYGLISITILMILILYGIENMKIFLFGLLWFLVFLISGIVGLTGFTNFLDHRLYVPIFGIFLLVSQLRVFKNVSSYFFSAIYLLIFVLFVYLNFNHSNNFRDELTFYKSAVGSAPNSFFTQRGIANVYHRMKDYKKAEEHYRKSLELNPSSVETLINVGINFKRQKSLDSAEVYLLRALKINPSHSIIHNNLGSLYLHKNKLAEAETYLLKAVQINRNYFEAYNNLGVLYARLMKENIAYNNFLNSIEINPDFAEGYFNLALFFYNKNEIDSSRYYYNKAIQKGFPPDNILSKNLNQLK